MDEKQTLQLIHTILEGRSPEHVHGTYRKAIQLAAEGASFWQGQPLDLVQMMKSKGKLLSDSERLCLLWMSLYYDFSAAGLLENDLESFGVDKTLARLDREVMDFLSGSIGEDDELLCS